MTIWIVWRTLTPLFPSVTKIELITASKERALTLAAESTMLRAEEHTVEDYG